MSEENELFGNAGEIYFAPVEGESGLDLTLEEDVRLNLQVQLKIVLSKLKEPESMTRLVGFKPTTTSEACTLKMYASANQKSLESLLK